MPDENKRLDPRGLQKCLIGTRLLDPLLRAEKFLAILKKTVSWNDARQRKGDREHASNETTRLVIPKLQEIYADGKRFDHIFVLGVHDLFQMHDTLWFQDLRDLHLGHADGHFWLFIFKDELPGNLYEEFSSSFPIRGKKNSKFP